MTTVTLELPDELAAQVHAHRADATRIVKIGLAGLKKKKAVNRRAISPVDERAKLRQKIIDVWDTSGLFLKAAPRNSKDTAPLDFTPVKAEGQPVSEIIIEQRGPRV